MEYLQYIISLLEPSNFSSAVLNLVISGIPSIRIVGVIKDIELEF